MRRTMLHRDVLTFLERARAGLMTVAEMSHGLARIAERQMARGPSKLARRMRRKRTLRLLGAY